jgi:hypothetical protein
VYRFQSNWAQTRTSKLAQELTGIVRQRRRL